MPSHDITLSAASIQTANFRANYPTHKIGGVIPKQDIAEILSQPGCKWLRYYYINPYPETPGFLEIVFVGVDGDGNDMVTGVIKDNVSMCPPNCGESNELNS